MSSTESTIGCNGLVATGKIPFEIKTIEAAFDEWI